DLHEDVGQRPALDGGRQALVKDVGGNDGVFDRDAPFLTELAGHLDQAVIGRLVESLQCPDRQILSLPRRGHGDRDRCQQSNSKRLHCYSSDWNEVLDQPFTLPAARPSTMYRWATM